MRYGQTNERTDDTEFIGPSRSCMSPKSITGEELSKLCRVYVNEDGVKLFPIYEYKSEIQYKSLLSQLTSLYRKDKSEFDGIELVIQDVNAGYNIQTYDDNYV